MGQKTDVVVIERWSIAAMGLAHTYADAMAEINGWQRENETKWSKYVYQLENSLSRAVLSGELRARERITGLYLEPGLDAYNDGVIDLQDFCNWARKAGLDGVPADALKVAAALRLPCEANLSVPQQAHTQPQTAKVEAAPVVTPEPQAGTVEAGTVEAPDPKRRLDALLALGGTTKHRNGEWRFTGMAALVKSEKGRKRSDEKTIRGDLKEAAQAERDAKQAGAFVNGLGQRGR